MKDRRETAKMPVLLGARRGSDPRRTLRYVAGYDARGRQAGRADSVAGSAVQINVPNVLADQIERLYTEYVRLGEERSRLAERLFTNMLVEKIERSAGRLEIGTERDTLDLREQFSKVSADYDRVQFRLGSLQHLTPASTIRAWPSSWTNSCWNSGGWPPRRDGLPRKDRGQINRRATGWYTAIGFNCGGVLLKRA